MHTGQPMYNQFNSLSAFWPGLQVLVGDIAHAKTTHQSFFYLWKKYGLLPERYWLNSDTIHDSERYYPLRPEVINSSKTMNNCLVYRKQFLALSSDKRQKILGNWKICIRIVNKLYQDGGVPCSKPGGVDLF